MVVCVHFLNVCWYYSGILEQAYKHEGILLSNACQPLISDQNNSCYIFPVALPVSLVHMWEGSVVKGGGAVGTSCLSVKGHEALIVYF